MQNERFHHLIYAAAQSCYLQDRAIKLQKRLNPYQRMQLHLRGRLGPSMAEHQTIVVALSEGNRIAAADALRGHVAAQGEKFQHLLKHLKSRQ